jgi:hypothetical protein
MRPKKSTQMVLDRNAVLRHPSGASIRFIRGEPIGVAPQLVRACIGMGAKSVTGDVRIDDEEAEDNKPYYGPSDPEERIEDMVPIIEAMIEKNDRSDWTGTGTPNVAKVTAMVGYKVTKEEILEAFNRARLTGEETEVNTGEE